jgi:hypothetical protein
MARINRRSVLAMGLGAASLLVLRTPRAEAAVGDERELAKGVKERILGEGPAMIPGYSKVSMRDIMYEPGATSPANPMKKDHVWTCAKGTTTEGATNTGTTVAIMRITDLLEA